MKEFSFEIQDSVEIAEGLKYAVEYLKEHPAKSVLVHVYSGYPERDRIGRIIGGIKKDLPDAMIVGITSGGEIDRGQTCRRSILIVISVFHSTEVCVKSYHVRAGEEETYGDAIRQLIDHKEAVKGVELLVDSWHISSTSMFAHINLCSPRVKIFGAVPYSYEAEKPKFLFTGDNLDNLTVIVITYAGSDFHISTDYAIGWKPMGVPMRVTRANGKVLNEIDGKPALAVYDKYLQIPNDEKFFENAFEFPFLRYVNDTYMLRMPYYSLPDGSLSLVASVKEGDTLYLSYGDIPTILGEIYEVRSHLERFHPEYVRLYNCATRKVFWKTSINRELEPFERLAPTAGCFTGGEILRVNGELVHFNATLLTIGMREGAPDPQEMLKLPFSDVESVINNQQTSMVRRMAHFINVAMQELLDTNRQLHLLATTDELTGLLNRRETNRILTEWQEEGISFSMIMADLDDFKVINDTYGHTTGDVVLQEVSGLIRRSVRGIRDVATGRWGGEEFMIILPDEGMERAEQIAEKLRASIEAFTFEKVTKLTISIGIADSTLYADRHAVYQDVDKALYAAKEGGKNCVVIAGRK